MPRGIKKENLPEKICPTCGKPFIWRKKWERNWDEIVYCSGTCREKKNQTEGQKLRDLNKGGVAIPAKFLKLNK